MPHIEHLQRLLASTASSWNDWLSRNPDITPDLSGAVLNNRHFRSFNFSRSTFRGAALRGSNFIGADCRDCDFGEADLTAANFRRANLQRATFEDAILRDTNFRGADLSEAVITPQQAASAINVYRATTTGFKVDPPPRRRPEKESAERWTLIATSSEGEEHRQIRSAERSPFSTEFEKFVIVFDENLSADQVKGCLRALAEYYRGCGGLGLKIDLELQRTELPESSSGERDYAPIYA